MQFPRRKRAEIGMDMTPMIDCVFQLLIFFLLSSSFLTPSVKLDLPSAGAQGAQQQATVVITLDANGQLHLNKRPLQVHEIWQALAAEFERSGRREVVLRADRKLDYDIVLKTLVELRQAGVEQVHLAYDGEK